MSGDNTKVTLPAQASETNPVSSPWRQALERSKAQLAAGEVVPLEPALDRLRASIARMEAKRAQARNR